MEDATAAFGPVAQARVRPDAAAVVEGARITTYADLAARTREVAGVLRALGVGVGDRVAVMLPNATEWFVAFHGIGRVGAIAVPVNTHFKADETGYVVRDAGAKAVLTAREHLGVLEPAKREGVPIAVVADAGVSVVTSGFVAATAALDDDDVVGDGWPTTMIYTSGTTGRPKGVAIGEGDFRRSAAGVAMMGGRWRIGPDDRYLLVGPAYHAGPAIWAHVAHAVGGCVVVLPRWDAADFLRLVEAHHITFTHLVPANFIRLLEVDPVSLAAADLSSLRLVLHAAAPCPVPVKRRIMDVFPPGTVWEYYGASEGGGTSISPQEWLERPGSVGRPYPGNEFKITDDDGVERPRGEAGVIWVRTAGAGSTFTYHNDPQKTAETYRDDWFSVGDVGYLDEDGYLYITDRKSDMVISGGVNIYPREIENCLYEHPDVVDCAVFGIPDDTWGEALVAIVEPTPGSALDAGAVVAWCREHLADYKRPRTVELVADLPRDPNGKVLKRVLRAELLARSTP